MARKDNEPTAFYPIPQATVGQAAPSHSRGRRWMVTILLIGLFFLTIVGGVVAGGMSYVYARGRILPGVSSLGIPLSGQTANTAAETLQTAWDTRVIILRQGESTWSILPGELGLILDADATAAMAGRKGRSPDDLAALLGERAGWFDVPPVWHYDPATAQRTLEQLAPHLAIPPVDAVIRIEDGRAVAIPATDGRELNVTATLATIQSDPTALLNEGLIDLVVRPVPAAVQDVSGVVDEANRLLATTVTLEAYDPVRDETLTWLVEPVAWSRWLRLVIDSAAPQTLQWLPDDGLGAAYLDDLESELGDGRTFNVETTLTALAEAIEAQQPIVRVRLYHPERAHIVQPGETLSSIGHDYGIPYPWIQQANPGVDQLNVDQTIVIPSPDVMLPLEPVPGKRIVVSLGEQRTRVYENGQLKWDWPASTGIDSSPTAPGVFQVQSHVPNAYAANWDLWMPSFMGIYRPVPSSDFMNGFHGYPTRGNAQLLWTNDLGRRVTYGCILLDSENAQLLYDWAEDGVVVEVRP